MCVCVCVCLIHEVKRLEIITYLSLYLHIFLSPYISTSISISFHRSVTLSLPLSLSLSLGIWLWVSFMFFSVWVKPPPLSYLIGLPENLRTLIPACAQSAFLAGRPNPYGISASSFEMDISTVGQFRQTDMIYRAHCITMGKEEEEEEEEERGRKSAYINRNARRCSALLSAACSQAQAWL